MSISSPDFGEMKKDDNETISRYALYIFNNKHAVIPADCKDKKSVNTSKTDTDELAFNLSLLEGNLEAEQETIVRCYLLKSLSNRDDLHFENEGKYTVLKLSEDSDESFGCYYHKLCKSECSVESSLNSECSETKVHMFLICFISADKDSLKNQENIQSKLKLWYFYCVEYISRLIDCFKEDLVQVLYLSLMGDVEIISDDEKTKWDLERLVETCTLMPKGSNKQMQNSNSEDDFSYKIMVENGKITSLNDTEDSAYCTRWFEKLKNCSLKNHSALRNILESFRLKAIQDLNILKRLLQKAQTDHYSLYRAYQFLQASGYSDVLLHHAKKEASRSKEEDVLEVISCLQDFIRTKNESSVTANELLTKS